MAAAAAVHDSILWLVLDSELRALASGRAKHASTANVFQKLCKLIYISNNIKAPNYWRWFRLKVRRMHMLECSHIHIECHRRHHHGHRCCCCCCCRRFRSVPDRLLQPLRERESRTENEITDLLRLKLRLHWYVVQMRYTKQVESFPFCSHPFRNTEYSTGDRERERENEKSLNNANAMFTRLTRRMDAEDLARREVYHTNFSRETSCLAFVPPPPHPPTHAGWFKAVYCIPSLQTPNSSMYKFRWLFEWNCFTVVD